MPSSKATCINGSAFRITVSYMLVTFRYQAQLQKNLLYLAAIADAQPQPPQNPASRPQVSSPAKLVPFHKPHLQHSLKVSFLCEQMMQPGMVPGAGHYMSQVPMFPPRTPLTPQQMQEQQQQQLQQQQAQALAFPGQMVRRPATINGMQPMQADPAAAASLQQSAPVPADGRGGKQDATAGVSTEPSGTESHKSTTGADHDVGSDVAEKS